MESKNKKILEALQMQPLSEEEKASRHILGRLYGPIATCKEKTRNGRGYNRELWEKALADDIFKEKLATKSLFLELGHPADREETDMKMVCACIPEMPKIVDGDLYAYVDILDTNNGRLLKTLCDYGFVPGISSRGSGDIMANDEVDPETFFLETWDIVQLPAVKKARLSVCESLENKKTLKTALIESYNKADEEGKNSMKEALDNLDITLDVEEKPLEECGAIKEDEIAYEDPDAASLVEEAEEEVVTEEPTEETEEIAVTDREEALNVLEDKIDIHGEEETIVIAEKGQLDNPDAPKIEVEVSEEEKEILEPEFHEEEPTEAQVKEEPVEEALTEAAEEEVSVEETPAEETSIEEVPEVVEGAYTVGAMINQFKDYDETLALEFKPIVIDDKELEVTHLEFDDSEEGKVVVSIGYNPVEDNNKEEVNSEEEPAAESAEETTEEAVDDGNDEVIESLKEAVRQKDLLEEEIRDLKNQKTVSDTEVSGLKEELEKYKTGFMRVSELAAKAGKLEKENTSLNEQLSAKDTELQDLKQKVENHTSLTESVNAGEAKVKELTEKLVAIQTAADETEKDLTEQLAAANKKSNERLAVAKAYKGKYEKVVERYIASKATMLGVRPTDITSKLAESYSLDDIDKVCDDLLNAGRPMFGLGYGASMKINESKETASKKRVPVDPDNGYEIDDDLLILAGLK